MFKNTFFVSFFLILSSFFGFFAQIVYANYFGTGKLMDLFFSILSTPTILTGMISVVFTSILIPSFAKYNYSEVDLKEYVLSLWGHVVIFSLFFSIIGFIFTVINLKAIVSEHDTDLFQTAYFVSAFVWAGSGLFIISSFLGALLNYEKSFLKIAWTSVLPSLLMILFVCLFHSHFGILCMAIGYFMAYLLQYVLFVRYLRGRYRISEVKLIVLSDSKPLVKNIIYVIFSMLPFTLFVPIGYYLALSLEPGSVSFLGYSQSFSGFLSVATGMGIAIVSFPDLANSIANKKNTDEMKRLENALKFVLLVSVFIATAFIVFRLHILTGFYQRGAFGVVSVLKLSSIIPFYLVSAVFIAGLNLLRTLFYSMGDYKILGILGLIIPIIFSILAWNFKIHFGVVGIGMANALSMCLLFVLCVYFARKRVHFLFKFDFVFFCLKLVLLSVVVYFITNYLFDILINQLITILAIMICISLYALAFFILGKNILKINELSQLYDYVVVNIKHILR